MGDALGRFGARSRPRPSTTDPTPRIRALTAEPPTWACVPTSRNRSVEPASRTPGRPRIRPADVARGPPLRVPPAA